jgi:hypothetical protein
MQARYNVLFLCTETPTRSIVAEGHHISAYSAGSFLKAKSDRKRSSNWNRLMFRLRHKTSARLLGTLNTV